MDPVVEGAGAMVWWASRLVGQPFYWPTRERMRGLLVGAGFTVAAQRAISRLPAGLLFPPVLSVAVRS